MTSAILEHMQLLNLILTAVAGILGVGIGIGLFRGQVREIKGSVTQIKDEIIPSIKDDIQAVKVRQAKLRGEDNGVKPVYMPWESCLDYRGACATQIRSEISSHTKEIRVLINTTRWWMQKEGLKIEEINQILEPK